MIMDYMKKHLDFNKPEECREMIIQARADIAMLEIMFDDTWTYCDCGGCRSYVRRADAYEGLSDNNRPVLRCGNCGSIWKFLD